MRVSGPINHSEDAMNSLTPDEQFLFRVHFWLGADHKLCCRYLRMDAREFTRAVGHIERAMKREKSAR